jgi:hypothetical protein
VTKQPETIAVATLSTLSTLSPLARIVPMGRNAGYAAGINLAVAAVPPHTSVHC